MKKLFIPLLILTLTIVSCNSSGDSSSSNKIVGKKPQKVILVYGSNTCSHCINFKAKLDSAGLKYTFYDVDVSDQYTMEMLSKVRAAGHRGMINYPVVDIEGKILVAPEFDEVEKILNQ